MIKITFEKRIYEEEFNLNDTDDSIIEFINEHRDSIQSLSIHNIAKALFISPNAIMRTAKKLGYSGFSELKFSLQQEQNPTELATVENRVLSKIPKNLIHTLDVIEDDVLSTVVDIMLNSETILFAGVGDSIPFCEIFSKNLRCLNQNVQFHPQIHDIEYISTKLNDNDLVIFISVSGAIERLCDLAKEIKYKKIKTVCLTNYGKNPLSDICDYQLSFWSEKRTINNYNITDRSGLMLLIRMLCEEYWKKYEEIKNL